MLRILQCDKLLHRRDEAVRLDSQNGRVRLTQYILSRVADEQAGDARSAERAHHNEINVFMFCESVNALCCLALDQVNIVIPRIQTVWL